MKQSKFDILYESYMTSFECHTNIDGKQSDLKVEIELGNDKEVTKFAINGIEADISDFCEAAQLNSEGCDCKESSEKVLEKYNLTEDDYSTVCDRISDAYDNCCNQIESGTETKQIES